MRVDFALDTSGLDLPLLGKQLLCWPLLAMLVLVLGGGSGLSAQSHQEPESLNALYHQVEAQRGDGVIALLRQFGLEKHNCNYTKFYALNQLSNKSVLHIGRSYQVPLQIFTYNSKSIRSTIGREDWTLAVAIQDYNDEMLAIGLKPDDFRKDKILWVPHHLLQCPEDLNQLGKTLSGPTTKDLGEAEPSSTQKTSSAYRTFDIFGKDYAKTPLIDNKLAGQVFYISAGHGGPDPGAMAVRSGRNLCEDEYAYDVALRFCRNIISHGGIAYMINRDDNDGIRPGEFLECDTDEVLWGGVKMARSQKTRLEQRSDIVNQLYEENEKKGFTKQTLICFHVDSRSSKKRIDLFFYHHDTDLLGKTRANKMQAVIRDKYNKHQRGRDYEGSVTPRDLHMLRETLPTGIYIELGNIRNESDQQRIILERNRQLLADWLYEGLL